jgi:hypothetical protein
VEYSKLVIPICLPERGQPADYADVNAVHTAFKADSQRPFLNQYNLTKAETHVKVSSNDDCDLALSGAGRMFNINSGLCVLNEAFYNAVTAVSEQIFFIKSSLFGGEFCCVNR